VIDKFLQAAIAMPPIMDGPNGLVDNIPDFLHCLVARVIMRPQAQALLIHAHHSRWQALAIPAGI